MIHFGLYGCIKNRLGKRAQFKTNSKEEELLKYFAHQSIAPTELMTDEADLSVCFSFKCSTSFLIRNSINLSGCSS